MRLDKERMHKLYSRNILYLNKLALVIVLGLVTVRTVLLPKHIEKSLTPTAARGELNNDSVVTVGQPDSVLIYDTEIVERNPFVTADEIIDCGNWESIAKSFGFETPASECLALILLGTIAGDPAVARSIIKDPKSDFIDVYKIGQTVAGARIEAIEKDAIVLLYDGRRETLKLNTTQLTDSNESNTPLLSFETSAEVSDAAENHTSIETSVAEVKTKLKCAEKILNEAVITPCIIDGEVEGLRLTSLDNLQAAQDLGLRNGDVLRVVNGHRLTSKQKAYQVFKKARSRANMDIEILRNDKTMRFSFNLQ